MTKFDWERARRRDGMPPEPPRGSASRRKPRGISNDQARELARLQRAAGVPYTGAGMTAKQAAGAIAELLAGSSPAQRASATDR